MGNQSEAINGLNNNFESIRTAPNPTGVTGYQSHNSTRTTPGLVLLRLKSVNFETNAIKDQIKFVKI
jgi:hypothetical protein